MDFEKAAKDYEKELRTEKKRYDKLLKQMKRATNEGQYETLSDDLEDCRQEIIQLQLLISEILREERKNKEMEELLSE